MLGIPLDLGWSAKIALDKYAIRKTTHNVSAGEEQRFICFDLLRLAHIREDLFVRRSTRRGSARQR
jgi:hypothetical protein